AQFVMNMLARVPQARPVSMVAVEQELSALAAVISATNTQAMQQTPPIKLEPPPLHPAEDESGPLRSQWQRPDAAVRSQQRGAGGGMRMLGKAVIALGVVGVGLVFFALPKWVEERAA